jgi:hypothetical protein
MALEVRAECKVKKKRNDTGRVSRMLSKKKEMALEE